MAAFDIYISLDGGDFRLWLGGTISTGATFHGASGHTYAFYSVAIDNAGNRQPTADNAQATTTVL